MLMNNIINYSLNKIPKNLIDKHLITVKTCSEGLVFERAFYFSIFRIKEVINEYTKQFNVHNSWRDYMASTSISIHDPQFMQELKIIAVFLKIIL